MDSPTARFKNMNIFGHTAEFSRPRSGKRHWVSLLSLAVLFATWPQYLSAYQDPQEPPQAAQAPRYAQQAPEQLQQLVAPIALYPDSLVAQILAASTFPEQVVEADRWVQAHPDLKGEALGHAVDQQPWDPSVKALVAFPSVLGNMDKNLSWTSSLGDAYYNQEPDVMDAVQVMRRRAQETGDFKSTPQQTVTAEGSTIIVEPADPDVVYIPAYDPWLVYGEPVVPWPGWYPYPGIWYGGPYLSFGIGLGIGFFAVYEWGWPHWGCDWHNHGITHNHGRYFSRSTTFYNRGAYYRGARPHVGPRPGPPAGGGPAGGGGRLFNHPGATTHPFGGDNKAARGYAEPHGQNGTRSGAFSGYDHGGQTRSFSSRGSASLGGGARGGGGGARGGGGRR